MPSYDVQARYDLLEQIAQRLGGQEESVRQVIASLRRQQTRLARSWEGRGANAFRAEMDGTLLPGLSRLAAALAAARSAVQKAGAMMEEAEREAAALFRVEAPAAMPPAGVVSGAAFTLFGGPPGGAGQGAQNESFFDDIPGALAGGLAGGIAGAVGGAAAGEVAARAAREAAGRLFGGGDPPPKNAFVMSEKDADKYLKDEKQIGDKGTCAQFVQGHRFEPRIGKASQWRAGESMKNHPNLLPGTVLATFNKDGKYPNRSSGNTVVVFLGYEKDADGNITGIRALHQFEAEDRVNGKTVERSRPRLQVMPFVSEARLKRERAEDNLDDGGGLAVNVANDLFVLTNPRVKP